MTSDSDDATRNGSTPMSTRRVTAATASLVCRVVSTRCPVREALSASSAVSWSRTSPTRTMSGSCRSTERRPRAKVSPERSCTCTCVMPGTCTSTGSSSVTMFRSGVLTCWMPAYSVFVLPEPVGPVMSTRPCACTSAALTSSSCEGVSPVLLSIGTLSARGSRRMTTFSPCSVGSVEMRASTVRPSTVSLARPSCGRRRSAMSRPDTILMRLTVAAVALRGTVMTSRSRPSTRYRMRSSPACGSTCTSEARARTASASTTSTRRTIGAASTPWAETSSTTSSCASMPSNSVCTSEESSDSDQERARWSRTWLSGATRTTSSVAPVYSFTSSSATTLVGSAVATFSRPPSFDSTSTPARSATARGSRRTASGCAMTRPRSTSGRPSACASPDAISFSVARPRVTASAPRRGRGEPGGVAACVASSCWSCSSVMRPLSTSTSPMRRRRPGWDGAATAGASVGRAVTSRSSAVRPRG